MRSEIQTFIRKAFSVIRNSKAKASRWFSCYDPRNVFMFPQEVFLLPEAISINKARLDHLASLGLPLKNKKVLEVGAGIGLLTEFFEKQGCNVLCTDVRSSNVKELLKRYPYRKAEVLDLEKKIDAKALGKFDIVFCYGTLYHLSNPELAIKSLAKVCKGLILIETCVTTKKGLHVDKAKEPKLIANQASYSGSRPTRELVMHLLSKYFGNAYVSKYQPAHPDFKLNWGGNDKGAYRAVFVGSKKPIVNKFLLKKLPNIQERLKHV